MPACHKITELFELLGPEWNKEAHLNLVDFLQVLANEAGSRRGSVNTDR